jgi:hypothetical protein
MFPTPIEGESKKYHLIGFFQALILLLCLLFPVMFADSFFERAAGFTPVNICVTAFMLGYPLFFLVTRKQWLCFSYNVSYLMWLDCEETKREKEVKQHAR